MARPEDPKIKEKLLEKCLRAVIESGYVNWNLNSLARRIHTSSRMLIYHFGSKEELEEKLSAAVEEKLRGELEAILKRPALSKSLSRESLELWNILTTPKITQLMLVSLSVGHRALLGDPQARRFWRQESERWITLFLPRIPESQKRDRKALAYGLFCLLQGVLLEYFISKEKARGRKAIAAITKRLAPELKQSRF